MSLSLIPLYGIRIFIPLISLSRTVASQLSLIGKACGLVRSSFNPGHLPSSTTRVICYSNAQMTLTVLSRMNKPG